MTTRTAHDFWNWFFRNWENIIDSMSSRQQFGKIMKKFECRLKAFHPELEWDLCPNYPREDKLGLVITADGRSQYFEAAKYLINQARFFDCCDIRALFPPLPPDHYLQQEIDQWGLAPGECYMDTTVSPCKNGKAHLRLYVDYKGEITREIRYLVLRFVFNLLGEEVYGLTLGAVAVRRLTDAPRLVNLQKLTLDDLNSCLGNYLPKLKVSTNGQLRRQWLRNFNHKPFINQEQPVIGMERQR